MRSGDERLRHGAPDDVDVPAMLLRDVERLLYAGCLGVGRVLTEVAAVPRPVRRYNDVAQPRKPAGVRVELLGGRMRGPVRGNVRRHLRVPIA